MFLPGNRKAYGFCPGTQKDMFLLKILKALAF